MQTDMILDAFVVDVEPPANVQPVQEYVWLRERGTGKTFPVSTEVPNILSILLSSQSYEVFVPESDEVNRES
jgi:hypothetical protein